jgi:hypothetical protein
VGWLAGVVMLWNSAVWTTRQKLLGTLVVPGGVALPVFLLFSGTSSDPGYSEGTRDPQSLSGAFVKGSIDHSGLLDGLALAALALMAIASIASAVYLWSRLKEARPR